MLDSHSVPLSSPTQVSPSALPFDVPKLQRQFDDEGYIVLPGVVSKQAAEAMRQALMDEHNNWKKSSAAFRGGGVLSGHLNCYPGETARGVLNELTSKGVLDLTRQLFPWRPNSLRLGCNFNLPGSVEQHIHMDGIYLESFMVVNVCLVDTTVHNGAIDLVPRTHKRFYRFWEFAAGRVAKDSTRVCTQQGDVLIRISTLWHRGMPNHSQAARPMMAVTLNEKHVDTDNPFAYNGGKVEFQANWFRTNLLGRLRERTTVHAPITYAAYRFARSLIGNKGYDS